MQHSLNNIRKEHSLSRRLAGLLRGSLLAAGLAACAACGAAEVPADPGIAAAELSSAADPAAQKATAAEASEAMKANLASYVSRAYQVPRAQIEEIIDSAIEAGRKTNLDPLLLLSITAVESTFNPRAKNKRSGASGLMQILPSTHVARGGKRNGEIFDIDTNLRVGSELLRDLIDTTGSLQRGLKHYVGAALLSHDTGYGNSVTGEHSRLKLAAEGNVNQAVKLKRARKPAESFGDRISGTFSEFRSWFSNLSANR
ncbi:MAG: lytic transglycosylase domain-containing protein [Sutterellaceae bacterium]|nr:lytic transglycosylase domain-containing protein [Sutterellaceae bacterium]MDD7441113.1 transglycosylase SLT domain-containing protein [Sutterellaceae bacterium]MDY2867444.1 transglycosylase SLT domain-containing protein [Mesosutterella sp.]